MATIYNFPNSMERDWHDIETELRNGYASMQDGIAILEDCLAAIQTHWQAIFTDVCLPPQTSQPDIPGPLTQAQQVAIHAALDASFKDGAQLVIKQLKDERHKHFGLLVKCEFEAAYFRRNGISLLGY